MDGRLFVPALAKCRLLTLHVHRVISMSNGAHRCMCVILMLDKRPTPDGSLLRMPWISANYLQLVGKLSKIRHQRGRQRVHYWSA